MQCKQTISTGNWGRTRQCYRNATHGDYCATHDPAAVARRRAQSDARYEERRAKSPLAIAARLQTQNELLRKEVKRLKKRIAKLERAIDDRGYIPGR